LAITVLLTAMVYMAAPARAGGGVGSAWVIDHSPYAITIQWSEGGDYSWCDCGIYNTNHDVLACWKQDGAKGSPCGKNGDSTTNGLFDSHTITADALTPGTKYHFQVFVMSFNKNGKGKCKYRELGEFTQTTDAFTPLDNVYITGTGENSLAAEVTTNRPLDFDFIRIAYMQIPTQNSLHEVAHTALGPNTVWGQSNVQRGWIDRPTAPGLVFVIDSLQACHEYEVVAYGFRFATLSNGTLLGQATNRTGIDCHPHGFAGLLIADHPEVLEAYAGAVHRFYCGDNNTCDTLSIFDHVAAQHPDLYDEQAAMIADGEWVRDEYETVEYLEDGHRDVFDAWQSELADAGMDMVHYTEQNFPAVDASINAEIAGKPGRSRKLVPTMTSSYPNPFNPETTIAFTVGSPEAVSLSIYDVAGRMVRILADETLARGSYTRVWDGRDNAGRAMASGIYFYKFVTGDFSETRKIVLLK
jgi:hypothetical protein